MHRCSICGFSYNDEVEEVPFSELSDNFRCPICYADKEDFVSE